MNIYEQRPLLVLPAIEQHALDLAARLGLAASALQFPVAVGDSSRQIEGRFPILIGRDNQWLREDAGFPPLRPGQGAITRLTDAVVIWGTDAAGQGLACLWAAACWSGEMTASHILVDESSFAALPDDPEARPHQAGWPAKQGWQCLSQAYSVEGLLGSRDGLFPDNTSVKFELAADLTLSVFTRVCDLAARIGYESNGIRLPLGREQSPAIRVGLDAGDGWIRLQDGGISLGAGPRLTAVLTYLARTFPKLPAAKGWVDWDLTAVADDLSHTRQDQPAILFEETWANDGEEKRFQELWRREILPGLMREWPEAKGLTVTVTISEPEPVREKLAAFIHSSMQDAGFPQPKAILRPAYKQGFYWLVREVLPVLRDNEPERVVICWRPLQEPGVRDLPIRWLQEVYPADEILARELGVPVDFRQAPADSEHALWVEAGRDGKVIWAAGFTPSAGRRYYFDTQPDAGRAVYPTGRITVAQPSGEIVITRHFPTDLELFWEWYSGSVLTRLESLVGSQEPLFSSLEIEYQGSEPEERLGVRQEIASPLEALHEDLYFTTLDRFAALGKIRTGQPFQAPGAILPWLKSVPGMSPRARVKITHPVRRERKQVFLTGLHIRGMLETAQGRVAWQPPAPEESAPPTGYSRPVNLAELQWHLGRLDKSAGCIRIRVASRSIGGKPVYALEAACSAGERMSPARLALLRPTLLINARHHANEVSATTAVLRLIDNLLEHPGILNAVNVVIVPLENVDGAAIHDLMQRDNPAWKLPAARYNQDGYEYYPEYFQQDTPYTEALALARLWREWLPDMVLDAHGVPSHEWVQCFSGYGSPPRFTMSFWLPNAHIYGILYEPRQYQSNVALGLEFAGRMIAAWREVPAIEQANQLWLDRYRAYGTVFLPERFPVEQVDGAVFYRQDAAERHISFAERHPQVTAIHCVTEVADETAQGPYLDLCAKAQLMAMQAAIDWLAGQKVAVAETVARSANGQIRRCRVRQRPQNS